MGEGDYYTLARGLHWAAAEPLRMMFAPCFALCFVRGLVAPSGRLFFGKRGIPGFIPASIRRTAGQFVSDSYWSVPADMRNLSALYVLETTRCALTRALMLS
jgi:hypothetical protein